jgi:hypothetical protein
MTKSKSPRKIARAQPVTMAGIPVNRFHSFERTFFKKDVPVLQGITFPLKRTSFKSGEITLDKAAKAVGAARLRVDSRTISYVLE